MKHARALALAGTATTIALRLIAVANMAFLAGFLLVALLAASRVHAAAPECAGTSMMEEIAASDPAMFARIEAAAAAVPNGGNLLWKIEKDGAEPSWLFGTMHMTDPRVTALTAPARAAFDTARLVVIETTDILDQSAMMATMMENPELTMFTGKETLVSSLSAEDRAALEKALSERGIPPASVTRMKPWMLSAMIALPACEMARKAAGLPVLDVKLAEDARAAGKEIDGLETLVSQFEAMASLPMELHMRGLIESLKLGDRMDDIIETMIALYADGEVGTIWPLFREVLPGGDEGDDDYVVFEETLIDARNLGMAEKAGPMIDRGGAFIAVGALHLPGENGLVELLRGRGYTVTAAD